MGAFSLLHPVLRAALAKHGYRAPTPVQEEVIPHILAGRNVLVVAPTGSGKTEAALLPVFSRILGARTRGIKAIYVTPLRSLNRDIFARMRGIASSVGLRLEVRHGDSTASEKRRFLADPPDIVVMTPETFYFMLSVDKYRQHIRELKYVIVDEAHELFSSKRGAEFSLALERLEAWYTLHRLQVVGLSATVEDPYELARRLFSWRSFTIVDSYARKKLDIVVDSVGEEGRAVKIAKYIEKSDGPVIVFANTRDTAEILGVELRALLGEEKVLVHHGSLSREERLAAEAALKSGKVKAVVATSSLELGIDIGSVELVVQYMSPRQASKLVQRAGRSGHGLGRVSRAVVVAEGGLFDILEASVLAARAMRGNLEPLPSIDGSLDALIHQLVGMVIERGELDILEAVSVASRSSIYSEKVYDLVEAAVLLAEAAGLLRRTGGRLRPGRRARSYYYSTTMIPDTFQYTVVDIESGKRIGVLDEEFVVTLEKGEVFVLAARLWEVVAIEDGVVRVKPRREKMLVPPSWEGDLIPVEYLAAREAASVLRRYEKEGEGVLARYPLTYAARRRVARLLSAAQGSGRQLPSDKRLVVEAYGDTVIVFSFLGSRGNRALEYLLAAYFEQVMGYPPRTGSTPYLVFLRFASKISAEEVVRALRILASMDRGEVLSLLEKAARRSRLYQWILLHVARRSGALPKDAARKAASIKSILLKLADTPLGSEALRELYATKLDVNALRGLLDALRAGMVEVQAYEGGRLSPLAAEAVSEARLGERLSPEKMPASLLAEIVKRKLSKRRVVLVCMSCGHIHEAELARLDDKPRCTRCGAYMLAPAADEDEARKVSRLVKALRQGRRPGKKEARLLRDYHELASLVAEYGKRAVEALATRGVGPVTARRVLRSLVFGEHAFYAELVKAEAQYYSYKHKLRPRESKGVKE